MPYRRSRPIINRDKHEVTWSKLVADESTTDRTQVYQGVQSADKNASTEVEIGHHVRSVYFELQFAPSVTTNVKIVHWNIVMENSGQTAAIPSLYYQPQRNQILKRGMEMLLPSSLFEVKRIFVVRIPRKYQRVAEGQQLVFQFVSTSSEAMNSCGFAIFKEVS